MRTSATYMTTILFAATTAITGCSSGEQSYDQPENLQTISKVQSFRESMQAYAKSGQIDSGTEYLIEEADGLKDEGVSNDTVQKIKSSLQEMVNSGNSHSAVKKKAEEVLTMLPESAAPAPQE